MTAASSGHRWRSRRGDDPTQHHYGNQGGTPGSLLRVGDFKLIEFFEDDRLELYNLRQDIGEEHNLADETPELADRLAGMLGAWRRQVEAKIPQPNPDYVPWRLCDLGTGE